MQVEGKVIVCDAIDEIGITILKKAGLVVDYKPEIEPDNLLTNVGESNVIIVRSRTKITKKVIDAAPNVKIIARVGVGLDNIDREYAESKGIKVLNAAEAAMNAVSELVIGHMIALSRSIPKADDGLKNGKWLKKELVGSELRGKYLGIIGVGNIGRNVGRIAKCLRMNLIGYDIFPINQDYVREVSMIKTDLKTLLENSDFVTCHVPLTEQTKHIINSETLSYMKPTSFLINTSRGEIIDEKSLFTALTEKRIAGAALDVFEVEPPTNTELLNLPNMIGSPHIAAQTKEAQELASTVIAEKVIQTLLTNR
ncbi:MAG TPA: D-2-hydroxyacid dehydrogenase [Nitrososphaeraceae archaeon]|jgi:D-3-phosphoglycerate dehydrogenase|nr:D-2-hydroxyacid dehydrogenase [Nitrososphaeraceae archaeon]